MSSKDNGTLFAIDFNHSGLSEGTETFKERIQMSTFQYHSDIAIYGSVLSSDMIHHHISIGRGGQILIRALHMTNVFLDFCKSLKNK